MKKRVLATLLCVAMVATLIVGCGGTAETPNPQPSTGTEDGSEPGSEPGTQKPEPSGKLSVEPVVYYPMESVEEGWKVVVADGSKASNLKYDASNIDGSRGIIAGDNSLVKNLGGVKGNALFLDRNYAIDLNFEPTNTDAWAVSFWLCTTGMTNYMPSLQMGSNMGYTAGKGNNVTWLNITQTDWVGATYPVLWSRNEASAVVDETGAIVTDCFPWMTAYDTEKLIYGFKEWVHVTVVATGDVYTCPAGNQAAGAQLYINGELRYDSFDNYNNATYFEVTDGLATMAPNIMKPAEGQTFEAYFGINYWDNLFKGCVDEFYVFDKAITADDVATLYAMGDPSVVPEMSSADDPKENAPELPDANSIQFVGLNNYTQGWWTTFSDIHEVASGTTKTFTFKNYHTNLNFSNWNNAAVILQSTAKGHSVTGTENGIDPVDGYKEYAVCRMDHYGWGAGYENIATATSDWDWNTFKDVTHGATVVCAITNHGTTADIVMTITAVDGTVHHQSYTGIAVDGPVYACFSVEKACIDIIEIK